MLYNLTTINQELQTAKIYIEKLCGNIKDIKPIPDDKSLHSLQENIESLRKLKKALIEYYKPIKQEAMKPYNEALEKEKLWLKSIEDLFNFADSRVKEYNNKKRIEIQERLQREADERAAEEKKRQEEEAAKLAAQGLTDAAQETLEKAQNIAPIKVAEVSMQSKSELNTITERKKVVYFKIINHAELAAALLSSGKEGMIYLDSKTETAFKKYLDNNENITSFPGCEFQRDYVNSYRSK